MTHFPHPMSNQNYRDPVLAKRCAMGKQYFYPDRFGQAKRSNMTRKMLIVYSLLILTAQMLSSQKISLGATFTNTDAYFLKNIPGIMLGYDHQIWKLNLFMHASAGKRDYSYTEYSGSVFNSVQIGNGEIFKGNVNLGASVNILSSHHYLISLGAFLGINYIHRVENIKSFSYSSSEIGDIYLDTIDYWYSNRLGWGVFLDVELMQVVVEQLSLFTRIEAGQSSVVDGRTMLRGIPFIISGYNSITFSFGMRYSLNSKNTSS